MTDRLLEQFLLAAKEITGAERGLVVDPEMHILQTVNLDPVLVTSASFIDFATQTLREALAQGEPIVTNNVITDPAQAPTTNTNFTDLRVIVAIPVRQRGAVYLEKHIRHGVIDRETVVRLMRLAEEALDNDDTGGGEDDLRAMYAAMQ
ncbi:hypothetical protein HC928_24745 [bacterium]|nr:hypothetical protein [bacterium]